MHKILGPTAYSVRKRNKSKGIKYWPLQDPQAPFLPYEPSLLTGDHLTSSRTWVSQELLLDSRTLPRDQHYKVYIPLLGSSCRLYDPNIDRLWLVDIICSLLWQYGS